MPGGRQGGAPERPGEPEPTPSYLVGLRLDRRRVVVVGGGAVAARRLPALLDAGADLVLVAPHALPEVRALAEKSRLSWQRRPFRAGDLDGAWYVVAATDDPLVNAVVAVQAEAARVFCVRVDDADAGTALTPATGRHDDLQVAVLAVPGAGPRDPQRTAAARDQALRALHAVGALGGPGTLGGPGGR